jgi:hypothetical protein
MSEKIVPIVLTKSGSTRQISPAKHWFLTHNNYTKEDIKLLCSDSSIIKYCFQEEKGAKGTPHLQGHFEFDRKIRPRGFFKGTPLENAHWEKTRNRRAAVVYCSKLATRSGETYIKGFPKSCFRKISCIQRDELYDWQKTICNECEKEPDDRTINWFWETVGNVGKSALVKYLCINENALLVSGKSADIKYQIANAEFPPDIIVYDIPRSAKNYINYTALEEIKNGVFCCSKYESKMCIIPTPHIYCFANFEPDLTTMSKDRWRVKKLVKASVPT